MARLAHVLGISGAAVLLAIPFIASAQEGTVPVDGDVVVDESANDVVSSDADADDDADADAGGPDDGALAPSGDADEDDVERAGPSWYEGSFDQGGKPPWAGGGRDGRGKPSWAGRDGEDRRDGAGPPWYEGDVEWSPGKGNGPPPWAGGPNEAGRAGDRSAPAS